MLKKIESSSLKKFPRSQQTVSSFCHSKPSSVGGRRGRPLVLRRLSSKGSPRASKEFWEEKDVLPSDPLNSSRELPRVETLSSLYAPELHRVVCRTTEEELGLGWFGPIPTPNECVSKKAEKPNPRREGGRERGENTQSTETDQMVPLWPTYVPSRSPLCENLKGECGKRTPKRTTEHKASALCTTGTPQRRQITRGGQKARGRWRRKGGEGGRRTRR